MPYLLADQIHNAIPELVETHRRASISSKRINYSRIKDSFKQDLEKFIRDHRAASQTGLANGPEHDLKQSISCLATNLHTKTLPLIEALAINNFQELMKQRTGNVHTNKLVSNFIDSFNGAFRNAIATILGLAKVVIAKVPLPKGPEAWAAYQQQIERCLTKNLDLIRNLGRFHFDVQLVFQNLQGIEKMADHRVYDFDASKFTLVDDKLWLTDEFIEEIIQECNKPDAKVSDNLQQRPIDFSEPAVGCPMLESETNEGNFYTEFCKWIHKAFSLKILPIKKKLLFSA